MSPSAPAAPLDLFRVRALLDDALVGLRLVEDPRVPVRVVSRHLEAALGHVYAALASTGEAPRFRSEAAAAIQRARVARVLLDDPSISDPSLRNELRRVDEALQGWDEATVRRPTGSIDLPRPEAKYPYARALRDVPALVQLERAVLWPVVLLPPRTELPEPLPAPPPAPTEEAEEETAPLKPVDALLADAEAEASAFEAAEAAAEKPLPAAETEPSGPLPPISLAQDALGVATTREERELECARGFFEELGMLGLMRQPDEGDLWSDLGLVEERLLARVDAIVACGEWVFPHLVRMLEDRPVPDPELTWAALFLYGSIAGDDALHQVVRMLRSVDLDDADVRAAAADALAHVPHPGIDGVLREWLGGVSDAQMLLAVRALGLRRKLEIGDCARLVQDSPLLFAEAIEALRRAPGEWSATDAGPLLRSEDESVVAAAIEASLSRCSGAGPRKAHALVADGRGDFADAYVFTALSGGEEAWKELSAAPESAPSDSLLEALGWFGRLQAMDFLLRLLAQGDVRAVGPLQRLTGASLTDEVPDPEYAEGEEPFVRPFTPPPDELELTAKPEIWSAWWAKHAPRANLRKRYRFGSLWSPFTNLWEMESAPVMPRIRRLAHLELVARCGAQYPFEPEAFVAEQRAQLTVWRSAGELAQVVAGGWPVRWSDT